MMDFLLEHEYSLPELYEFFSEVFDCSAERIKIYSLDEFSSATEALDCSGLDGICVFSSVRGSASQLLQLYRYELPDSTLCRRVIDIACRRKMHCYIPTDSLNGWTYVGDDGMPKRARQIECDEDDCYLFELR